LQRWIEFHSNCQPSEGFSAILSHNWMDVLVLSATEEMGK
jgi:hypothetical protein